MTTLRTSLTAFVLVAGLLLAAVSQAQTPARFDFTFEDPGSNATATGFVVFDLDLLPNPGDAFPISLPSPTVVDLEITVTGAAQGNGTYGLADYGGILWSTGGVTLDLGLGVQVVGQPTASGSWGPGCGPVGPQGQPGCGEFNLLTGNLNQGSQPQDFYTDRGIGTPAPNGIGPFTLGANGGTGEPMELTSFVRGGAPAPNNVGVPALSHGSLLLMISLLLVAGWAGLRLRG